MVFFPLNISSCCLQQGHKKTFSDLYASCGIIFDNGSSFKSFLESNHTAAALQIINESLSIGSHVIFL